MRLRRPGSEIAVGVRDEGLVVRGHHVTVDRFVERLNKTLAGIDPALAVSAVEVIKHATDSKRSGRSADTQLFEFSPRALELLRQDGALAAEDGFFRSMVRDNTSFVGNLDWKPVMPGPELVQLQTIAVTMALQATIKDLADAVARVEDKVDDIRDLILSDQIGQVVAHHRVLTPLVRSIDAGGSLTNTDWGSIDDLRPEIVATVERTRLYIAKRVSTAEVKWTAQGRSKEAERLIESDFASMLALLETAEYNLASWHRLRVERVRNVEPQHIEATLTDVDRELRQQRDLDTELVEALAGFLVRVSKATGYEGLEPLARRSLQRHIDAMAEATLRFVGERSLDSIEIESVALPTLSDSVSLVVSRTSANAKKVGRRVRRGGRSTVDDEPTDAIEVGDHQPDTSSD